MTIVLAAAVAQSHPGSTDRGTWSSAGPGRHREYVPASRVAFMRAHPERYSVQFGQWVEANPVVVANRSVVPSVRFDSFGTVVGQREARKVGAERLKAETEYDKNHRGNPISMQGAIQIQRQDQFQHKAP